MHLATAALDDKLVRRDAALIDVHVEEEEMNHGELEESRQANDNRKHDSHQQTVWSTTIGESKIRTDSWPIVDGLQKYGHASANLQSQRGDQTGDQDQEITVVFSTDARGQPLAMVVKPFDALSHSSRSCRSFLRK